MPPGVSCVNVRTLVIRTHVTVAVAGHFDSGHLRHLFQNTPVTVNISKVCVKCLQKDITRADAGAGAKSPPRRWNRTTALLSAYRFEACNPDHRMSSGHWRTKIYLCSVRRHQNKTLLNSTFAELLKVALRTKISIYLVTSVVCDPASA